MLNRLPILIDPIHLARRGYIASGVLPLAQFTRLKSELSHDRGEVDVSVEFGHNDDRLFLAGHIKGKIDVPCQRCLQPVPIAIDHQFRLGIITREEDSDWLLDGEDPLMVTGEEMQLSEIIEDELLLQLPMVCFHESKQCNSKLDDNQAAAKASGNPFAVLAKLKTDKASAKP